MFDNIDILLSVDFTSFDTSQVKNKNSMFKYCSNLISLDLSNFDTSLVTTMESMFYSCTSLTSLDISNFNTTSVTNIANMFGSTYNLNFINLLNYIGSSDIFTNIGSKNVCIREMPAGSFSAINIYGAIDISININFCVYLKSINVGIYSDNKITKLKEVDYCNWKINLGNQKRESLFEFKFILYEKNNIILRSESKERVFNLTNLNSLEDNYGKCTYSINENPCITYFNINCSWDI